MEDWCGPISDPEINRRFVEAVETLAVRHGKAVGIYTRKKWPPNTVGVSDGKPCASRDLHEAWRPSLIPSEEN